MSLVSVNDICKRNDHVPNVNKIQYLFYFTNCLSENTTNIIFFHLYDFYYSIYFVRRYYIVIMTLKKIRFYLIVRTNCSFPRNITNIVNIVWRRSLALKVSAIQFTKTQIKHNYNGDKRVSTFFYSATFYLHTSSSRDI